MYEYRAEVVRVVDGDTLDVSIDLGFGIVFRPDKGIRLAVVNTAEIHGVKKESEEYAAGMESTTYVTKWLGGEWEWHHRSFHPIGDPPRVIIQSHLSEDPKPGKYGRYIIQVKPDREDGKTIALAGDSLNQALIHEGYAK
jgi:endonuclease YncB( thermonuclease family)